MQTINLDISMKTPVPILYFKQKNVGSEFAVRIFENAKSFNVDGNSFSVWYSGTSGDGNYSTIDGETAFSIDGNEVKVEMITQMVNSPGDHEMCLIMKDADENQIGFWNIPYFVEAIPGADSEEATQYFNELAGAADVAKEAAEDAEAAQVAAGLWAAAAERAADSVSNPVSYKPQELTEEEKAQARKNIGAVGIGEGGGGTSGETESLNKVTAAIKTNNSTIRNGFMSINAGTASFLPKIDKAELGVDIGEYVYLYVFTNINCKFRPLISCYNASNTSVGMAFNIDHGLWGYVAIRVPDDTVKIEFGCRNQETANAIEVEYFITKNLLDFNHLYGRSILAFGDSITYGANNVVGGVSKSYIDILAERNNMSLKKYAQSGATFVKTGTRACIYDLVGSAISAEAQDFPDIIVVSGGFNDSQASINNTLGDFTDNDFGGTYDTNTIIGTIEKIFHMLRQRFFWRNDAANWIRIPKIVFALEYIELGSDGSSIWATNRKKVRDVCEKWGVPCIDMNSILQVVDGSFILSPLIYTDGTHPDSKGYMILANGFEKKLKDLYF